MKARIIPFLLTIVILLGCGSEALAKKKMNYNLVVYKLVLNGDTMEKATNLNLSGIMKGHTKRLPMLALEDGSTLHIELWVTKEGVAAQKLTVFQHKYYTKKDEYWTLMAVTPRLKFVGDHLDRGHYYYRDPQSGESLEIFYQLTVTTVKKLKRRGRRVDK